MVNLFDENADTSLHRACQRKQRHHIVTLLKAGADVELENDMGESYLTYLENDKSLFPINCDPEIQKSILSKLKIRSQASPNNEALQQLLAQTSTLVSSTDTTHHMISDSNLKNSLQKNIEAVAYSENKPLSDKLFNKIVQERLFLQKIDGNLESVKNNMSARDREFYSFKNYVKLILFVLSSLAMIALFLHSHYLFLAQSHLY